MWNCPDVTIRLLQGQQAVDNEKWDELSCQIGCGFACLKASGRNARNESLLAPFEAHLSTCTLVTVLLERQSVVEIYRTPDRQELGRAQDRTNISEPPEQLHA